MALETIVIIGGGHAACAAAVKLRNLGFSGSLKLLTQESTLPYHRPPLSKKYLMGDTDKEGMLIRPQAYYAENRIDVRTGQTITRIDGEARRVEMADGSFHGFDKLLIATGSRARPLPASMVEEGVRVYTVRTLQDVDGMRPGFKNGSRLLIIGGGYIGLEAASVAVKLGLHVTLVEAAPRILQRVAACETSRLIRDLHVANGVNIIENAKLTQLTKSDGHSVATFEDGSTLDFDFAIVGIGAIPVTDLAEEAGLEADNGIWVDEFGRTSHPDIYAAGDCASFFYKGRRIRLESVQNAQDQAENAVENMLGARLPYHPVPWFWSDQFDMKMQIVGLNHGYQDVIIRPGVREGAQSHWYFSGDKLLAVDAFNDGGAFMAAKRMLEARNLPTRAAIADLSKPPKEIMKETL